MPTNDNQPTIFDTFVKEITSNLEEVLDTIRADFNGPKEGDVMEEEGTTPEAPEEEENDLTPENFLNEAVRLLQLAEDTASLSASGTYVAIADRYTYLAENF